MLWSAEEGQKQLRIGAAASKRPLLPDLWLECAHPLRISHITRSRLCVDIWSVEQLPHLSGSLASAFTASTVNLMLFSSSASCTSRVERDSRAGLLPWDQRSIRCLWISMWLWLRAHECACFLPSPLPQLELKCDLYHRRVHNRALLASPSLNYLPHCRGFKADWILRWLK